MFCAFQGPPKILRLHGVGRVVEPRDADFAALRSQFPEFSSTRAIIVVEITRVADSCGYGVPLMSYQGDRTQLSAWAAKKGIEGLKQYQRDKNRVSMDGLPGVEELCEIRHLWAGVLMREFGICIARPPPGGLWLLFADVGSPVHALRSYKPFTYTHKPLKLNAIA